MPDSQSTGTTGSNTSTEQSGNIPPEYTENPIQRIPLDKTKQDKNSKLKPKLPNLLYSVKETKRNEQEQKDEEPPLINVKITNPVTYLKHWWKKIIANEGIDLRLRVRPLTAIAMGVATVSILTGTGFTIARFYYLPVIVPNSLVSKTTSLVGTIHKSNKQYFLISDNKVYTLNYSGDNLADLINKRVLVVGKLSSSDSVIDSDQITQLEPNIVQPVGSTSAKLK